MCGICGIINLNSKPVSQKNLEKMVRVIRHRGPDDEGYFVKNQIGLANCRLAILDLSSAGHQPMHNEDKTLWVVYNGEIYNFEIIKKELETLGHQFKSNCDTEVILHAYEQWQKSCLDKFNGMWAFAIWDAKKQELFCSRDRLGIKPFYYFFDGRVFALASEIKSLLTLNPARKPNSVLIYDFLNFGMLDHTNETFFKNIQKLPPGCWLKIKSNGQMIIKKYWDFTVNSQIGETAAPSNQYNQEFLEVLTQAVKLRLRSDVAVGTCLSGGLDSSSIVCLISGLLKKQNIPHLGRQQKTFSACYDIPRLDERQYIEEVVKQTGVEKNYIFPQAAGFLKDLDQLLWHQEEPFAGTSVYAQWEVMKLASQKVKVLLDGQGADEILCGYRKFYMFYLKKLWQEAVYRRFIQESFRFFSSPQIIKTLNLKHSLKYFQTGENLLKLDSLFQTGFSKTFHQRQLNFSYDPDLGQRIKQELTTWSLPVLLRYEDKNSMAHSIEARVPFLDHHLVEQISALPLNQKMGQGWTKVILRNSLQGILPEKIRLRKSKLGFDTPEDLWMKTELEPAVSRIFQKPLFINQYINQQALIKRFQKFQTGRSFDSGSLFFRFYILELWARKFILNRSNN